MQATPWDVLAALGYVGIAVGILLATGGGNPVGLLLVLVIPGYLATVALLPRALDASWPARIGLSLGLDIALVAFLGMLLNFMPTGVTFPAEVLALLFACVLLGILAYLRRMAVSPLERLEISLDLTPAPWKDYSPFEKGLTVALVVVLVVAVPLLGLSLTQPRPTEPYTELYLLGPTGNFTGYPSVLNVSQPGTLQIVVANHEGGAANYTLQLALQGVQVVVNATTGVNETLVLNQTAGPMYTFSIPDGMAWTEPYTFSIPVAGTWRLVFDLFKSSDLLTPYRGVYFLVTVP